MEPVELNELIGYVRSELLKPSNAKTTNEAMPVLFVEEVELEVSVVISHSKSGDGKINFQIVEIGGEVNNKNESIHKVRVKMSPLLSKEKFVSNLERDTRLSTKLEEASRRSLLKEDGVLGEE